MYITYFVPDWSNIGDLLIFAGIYHRIEKENPGAIHQLFYYGYGKPFPEKTDLFVVCGTPWLWDICSQSKKYKDLNDALKLCKSAKKIALGIGSCYPLGWKDPLHHRQTNEGMKNTWKQFDEIEVRDDLAKTVLTKLNIKSVLKPCPAFDAAEYLGAKHIESKNVVFIPVNIDKHISSVSFSQHYKNNWNEQNKAFIKINKPKIITTMDYDLSGLKGKLIKANNKFDHSFEPLHELFNELAYAKLVVTARVHAAVAAVSLNIPTVLWPLDSRALTLSCGEELRSSFKKLGE